MTTAKTTKSTMQSLSSTGEMIVAGMRVNQEALKNKPIEAVKAVDELNKASAVIMEKTDVSADVRNALMIAGACILQQSSHLKEICSKQEPKEVTQEETVNE